MENQVDYSSREFTRFLLQKPVVGDFLKVGRHYELFKQMIADPTFINQKLLDEAFRAFFLEIRLTAYLSTLIHYTSVDFDKKHRRLQEKANLILDSHQEYLTPDTSSPEAILMDKPVVTKLEEIATSFELFKAFRILTEHEKTILIEAYGKNLTDTQIAKKNHVSQQTISKTRTKALKKLRAYLIQQ